MFRKLKLWWTTVDKPEVERVYHKGQWSNTILYFLICYILGWGVAWLMEQWDSIQVYAPDGRYEFQSWAVSYFIRFFLMVIPVGVSMTINSKSKTPAYGFAAIGGFFCAALSYIFITPYYGIYMAYVTSLAILGNIPSQGDFTIKIPHLIYYFILGFYACYVNTVYQMMAWDVWVWLQMIHVHLFSVIIAAVKIRQWSYMFMFGWAACAIWTLFAPLDLYIFRLDALSVFPVADLRFTGWYNLIVPPILTLVILYYFFNIQRKVEGKYIGMDK